MNIQNEVLRMIERALEWGRENHGEGIIVLVGHNDDPDQKRYECFNANEAFNTVATLTRDKPYVVADTGICEVYIPDERDALAARVADLEAERDGLRAALLDGEPYIYTQLNSHYHDNTYTVYLMEICEIQARLSVDVDDPQALARMTEWAEETARKHNIPANRIFIQDAPDQLDSDSTEDVQS